MQNNTILLYVNVQKQEIASQFPAKIEQMRSTTQEPVLAVKTAVFEGPLELLIELVEKRKLLINDISLAEVTDEYMQRVSEMQERSLPNTAQFITLAATLLLIKSKSLLPVLVLTDDEEEKIEDLEERLKLYQIIRSAGRTIQREFNAQPLYSRTFVPPSDPLFITDRYTTVSELQSAIDRVIHNLPKFEEKPKARVRPVVSLEEMISSLQRRIEQQLSTTFREFTANTTERPTMIVSFLAVLELVKQGEVLVRQDVHFADMIIEKEGSLTPTYH